MKKPKITFKTIHTGHQFIDVEGVSNLMTCNAYSEMIDALIASTELLNQLKTVVGSKAIFEIEQQIEMNKYSALRKAGVDL